MKKNYIFNVIVIFCVLLIFCIVLIVYNMPEKTDIADLSEDSFHTKDYITVTIDDKMYKLSFDSIKGMSELDSINAKNIVLEIDRTFQIGENNFYLNTSDSIKTVSPERKLLRAMYGIKVFKSKVRHTVVIDSLKTESSEGNFPYTVYGFKSSVNIPASSSKLD